MFHMEHRDIQLTFWSMAMVAMVIGTVFHGTLAPKQPLTGVVTRVISCYGPQMTLPEPCKRDNAVQGVERLHVSFIHVPSLHATYETTPYIGWAPFAHHDVPVVGRQYKIRIKGHFLKWYIGRVSTTNPSGPQLKPSWQKNYIWSVAVDPPKER